MYCLNWVYRGLYRIFFHPLGWILAIFPTLKNTLILLWLCLRKPQWLIFSPETEVQEAQKSVVHFHKKQKSVGPI